MAGWAERFWSVWADVGIALLLFVGLVVLLATIVQTIVTLTYRSKWLGMLAAFAWVNLVIAVGSWLTQ